MSRPALQTPRWLRRRNHLLRSLPPSPLRPPPRHPRSRADLRFALSFVLAASLVFAAASFAEQAPGPKPLIDPSLYGRLLEAHTQSVTDIVGTRVDYRALRGSAEWKQLAAQVRAARPSNLDREGQLAFWINAYNILTIDLILKHYPVDSIRDIGSFFSPVWNVDVATIEGRTLSLGEIEHEILRKMGEPRIHAAIVCASTSCPPLARTPFSREGLDAQLDGAMRRWLASPDKGVAIDRGGNQVSVSAIFDWFEEDFQPKGGVLATIARYVSEKDAAWIRTQGRKARLRFLDYDWTLNDVKR